MVILICYYRIANQVMIMSVMTAIWWKMRGFHILIQTDVCSQYLISGVCEKNFNDRKKIIRKGKFIFSGVHAYLLFCTGIKSGSFSSRSWFSNNEACVVFSLIQSVVGLWDDFLNEDEVHFARNTMSSTNNTTNTETHIITPNKGVISNVPGRPARKNEKFHKSQPLYV